MFDGVLAAVPFFWKIPVLLLFVLLIMFVMILCSGYKVRLPFFLGEIGPGALTAAPRGNNLALEQEIVNLKRMLENLSLDSNTETPSGTGNLKMKALESEKNDPLEFVPLGYDCAEKMHMQKKYVKTHHSESAPSTPRRIEKLKKNILTPVKCKVISQPEIFRQLPATVMGDSGLPEAVIDLSTKLSPTAIDLSNCNEPCADGNLASFRKRSDSSPPSLSPMKTLKVEGFSSPQTTNFEWIEAVAAGEENDDAISPHSEGTSYELLTEHEDSVSGIKSCQEAGRNGFLNKVEEIFEASEDL